VAIGTAAITVCDVAVIADLTGVDHTIAAATGINAYRLPGSADLLLLADLATADHVRLWKRTCGHDRD